MFIIGGSLGLSPQVIARADFKLVSPVAFPHQLAQVMLLEQTYRAMKIAAGGGITNVKGSWGNGLKRGWRQLYASQKKERSMEYDFELVGKIWLHGTDSP